MLFSYNWLQSFFNKKLPAPEKLAELLTMHSFEKEETRKKGRDWVLDINVLPDRAGDCFCHLGIAREIAAVLNSKLKTQNSKPQLKTQNFHSRDFIEVEIQDKNDCPRYTAKVMTDVKVGPSPKWLQERLQVCGLRPINNIVDITNYVMLEMGQPLHAFDWGKLATVNPKFRTQNTKSQCKIQNLQKRIVVRRAKSGEKITTLDGQTCHLDESILVIADEKTPLAIAGVKGGRVAEIDKKTKTVVLESANFDKTVIRRASQKLNLRTDASLRFEHGLDPNLTELAIEQVAFLLQEIANGKIAQGIADSYPEKVFPKKINLNLDYVEKLLGTKIPKNEIIKILRGLGFEIKATSILQSIEVRVPTRRIDVSIQEDLIEEVGRIYGYEKIQASFPRAALIPPKNNLDLFWEDMIKDILKGLGFCEVYNYSFIGDEDARIGDYEPQNLIELENPISQNQKYLRPDLLLNLLRNLKENLKNFERISIFELGKVFTKSQISNLKSQILEKKMLSGLMAQKSPAIDIFYQAKGVIDVLLNKLGISHIWYDAYQPTPDQSHLSFWQVKKCAEIKIDNEEIGFLGEVSARVMENLKITAKTVVFDLDFEKLIKLSSEEQEYRPLSPFPAAIRDLAVLVPRTIVVEEVLNKIEAAGGTLLRDVDVFDIYEGEELPDSKKNLAFHLIFQAEDRTLKASEINQLMAKIMKALEEDPEWEVRK